MSDRARPARVPPIDRSQRPPRERRIGSATTFHRRVDRGALETVVANETGLLVDALSAQAFADAIARAMDMDRNGRFDKPAIRRHAERFSRERFCHEMAALIESDAQFSS